MKRVTFFVICLFAVSGVSGLIYELVWIRLLSYLLGGTTFAISTVLACFMAGLGLGSFFLGRLADRSRRPLRLYAVLELGVAVVGASVPLLIGWITPLYVGIAQQVSGPALDAIRVLLAATVIILPTFLMGGTLPVLSRFLVRRRDRLGRGIGLLYAVNTLGAVLGAFLTGYVFIPALGLQLSMAVAVAGNVLAGLAALLILRWLPADAAGAAAQQTPSAPAVKAQPAEAGFEVADSPELDGRLLVVLFAVTGFIAFGYELYWTRALQHFLGNSTYAFSAMLTTFLFGLAAGGWWGGRLADRVRSPASLLGWLQIGVAASALSTVPLIWNWLPGLAAQPFLSEPVLPWSSYILRRFVLAFAVMAVPSVLVGMAFPLVNRIGIASLSRLGRGVGRLYFANTVGSIVGSLTAGFVILPWLGARNGLLATALLSGCVGVTIHLAHRQKTLARPLPAAALVLLLAVLVWPVGNAAHLPLSDTQSRSDTVLFQKEDATAETRVYRKANGELHMSVDGHLIGGTGMSIIRKEKILAHLPMTLVPRVDSVLAVGLGSGITLGTLALYPEITKLVCLEIVPGVVEGAAQFRQYNHDVLNDPRLEVIVGDGVQYLLTTRERFDVISSDSKLNPEYAGNSVILSRDYYELCRDRLTEGGVMVQWLGINFPQSELEVVLRSFLDVFPHVELFWNDSHHMVVAGSEAPIRFDMDRSAAFRQIQPVMTDLQDLILDDPYVMPSCRVAGRPQLAAKLGPGRLNTWLHPTVEFHVLPEFRSKPIDEHEDDTFAWLAELWSTDGFEVVGDYDPQALERFQFSSRKFFQAISTVESSRRRQTGEQFLRAGLRYNPADRRLETILGYLQPQESGSAAVASQPPVDAPALMSEAVRQLEAGQAQQALAALDDLVELFPQDANVRFQRLRALRQLGHREDFRSAALRYNADFPKQANGYFLLGLDFLDTNDYQNGLDAFEQALAIDPQDYRTLSNIASTLVKMERFQPAADAFARVYEMAPSVPGAAFSAAACYSRAGSLEQAARWVDLCLRDLLVDPNRFISSDYFAALRGSELWDQQEVERAAAAYRMKR